MTTCMENCCSPGCPCHVYDGVFVCCPFSKRDVLDEILNLNESFSEGFPTGYFDNSVTGRNKIVLS